MFELARVVHVMLDGVAWGGVGPRKFTRLMAAKAGDLLCWMERLGVATSGDGECGDSEVEMCKGHT